MNYCKTIIEKYNNKQALIQSNLSKDNIFPNRNEPLKSLSAKDEAILKATFSLRIAFLNEFEYLFAYCYSKNTFEQTILDLESQGYISSRNDKEYGKHWILTKQALYYIYDNTNSYSEASFPEDKFPTSSKLAYHKCVNSYIANRVFTNMTNALYNKYSSLDKGFRNKYSKEQFLKYVAYDKNSEKKDINTFVATSFDELTDDTLLHQKYKTFVKYFKAHLDEPILLFNFLKDLYASEPFKEVRDNSPYWTTNELNRSCDNILRNHTSSFRRELIASTNIGKETLNKETSLYLCDEFIKQFTIHKRCLLNTKPQGLCESELATLTQNIQDLENGTIELTEKKEPLSSTFAIMLFDHFENDLPQFKESKVTFESLRQEGVLVSNVVTSSEEKPTIKFIIPKPTNEPIAYSYISTRIQKIHMLCWKTLVGTFNYEIQIQTYSQNEQLQTREILKTLCNDFNDIQELRIIDFKNIKVNSAPEKFKERYEVFAYIRPLIMNI